MRAKWTVVLIAFLVLWFPLQGMALGADWKMYMISYEPNWGSPESDTHWAALYTIDINNGAATKVGDIEYQGNKIVLTDITFSNSTLKMYAINSDDTGTQLYTLQYNNPVSGIVQATLLHTFTVTDLQGLALSPEGEYLYAGSATTGAEGETPGALYLLYPDDGKITLVGSLGSISADQPIGLGYGSRYNVGGDLDFDEDNILYASICSNTADHSADIFGLATLDPSSGQATLVGSGFENPVTGMAYASLSLPLTAAMYACDFSGAFYQVNTQTGTLTYVGSNGICQVGMTFAAPYQPPGKGASATAALLQLLLQ
jgi:hypothetical protein